MPTAIAAAKKEKPVVKPRFDPPDLPFRMAPMPQQSRSIAIPLATNVHLAFDTELCRTHTVWSGSGLNLLGPQYSNAKTPFISTNGTPVLWTMPPETPWFTASTDRRRLPARAHHRAVTTSPAGTSLHYQVEMPDGVRVPVTETPRAAGEFIVRRIKIGPAKQLLGFVAHSEFGRILNFEQRDRTLRVLCDDGRVLLVRVGSGDLEVHADVHQGSYTEEIFSESGAEKGNEKRERTGRQARLVVGIPPRDHAVTLEVASLLESLASATAGRTYPEAFAVPARKSPSAAPVTFSAAPAPGFSMASAPPYYRAEAFPLPKEIELLVTGMDFLPNGDLAVCTWPGDLYIVEQATGPVAKAQYRRFARGLCEPMGLVVKAGQIYVGMKNELARVADTDGNGEADLVERLNAEWAYTGHYNAFSYGPVLDKNGDFVLANAGHSGRWDAKYMGWAFRVSADGTKLTPICSGFREPNGIGVFGPEREVFVSENQGNWIGACRLDHVSPGKFHGHPSAWPSRQEEYRKHTRMDPPAVWFPYKLARSTTGLVEIPDDRFGPFKGQLLVGDFQNAIVTRVQLERVNGEYQGAVWPFLKRFASGVNRLAFGPDGKLYVGGCQRTWASIAPKEAALERVSFLGKAPFEVREVHARADGFELTFTEPVGPATAGNPQSYDVLQYGYRYHEKYGSPEIDHAGKPDSATAIEVAGASASADGLKVRLQLKGWKTGYVTMVRGLDVRSAKGEKLWNDTFWYTLNQVPPNR